MIFKLLNFIVFTALLFLTWSAPVSAGGDPVSAPTSTVTGTVTYRERIALPSDAVVRIRLQDVSLMDVAAKLISEQVINPEHSVPIPFVIHYDPAEIREGMSYSVSATIHSGERLLFVSDTHYPVLTRGNSDRVDLVLKMIQP